MTYPRFLPDRHTYGKPLSHIKVLSIAQVLTGFISHEEMLKLELSSPLAVFSLIKYCILPNIINLFPAADYILV